MLSSRLEMPREGHMQELLHVFTYLKKHMNTEMVFDPIEPEIDMNSFQCQDWIYSIYSSPVEELKEALPPNMPKPLGHGFKIRFFVDANHTGGVFDTSVTDRIYCYVEQCSHLLALEKSDLCRDEHLWK